MKKDVAICIRKLKVITQNEIKLWIKNEKLHRMLLWGLKDKAKAKRNKIKKLKTVQNAIMKFDSNKYIYSYTAFDRISLTKNK